VISSFGMKCAVGLCKISSHLQTPHCLIHLYLHFSKWECVYLAPWLASRLYACCGWTCFDGIQCWIFNKH